MFHMWHMKVKIPLICLSEKSLQILDFAEPYVSVRVEISPKKYIPNSFFSLHTLMFQISGI